MPARARARRRPLPASVPPERARRALDVLVASVLLILVAPVLLVGVAIVALNGRPIFFGHERMGRDGLRFRCWKLRTMHPNAEAALDAEPDLAELYLRNGFKIPAAADPRITPAGNWLRRTYIDELPQLFNVLNGTMSLIGPRPIIESELQRYGRGGDELLRVKPGLFGAWTSMGRDRPAYPERALLELEYVRTRSFARDLKIFLRAIPAVLAGQSE
jgi:lipopolysaccharide/colanic/teichoic acid biosynthesis glycosyltransferase